MFSQSARRINFLDLKKINKQTIEGIAILDQAQLEFNSVPKFDDIVKSITSNALQMKLNHGNAGRPHATLAHYCSNFTAIINNIPSAMCGEVQEMILSIICQFAEHECGFNDQQFACEEFTRSNDWLEMSDQNQLRFNALDEDYRFETQLENGISDGAPEWDKFFHFCTTMPVKLQKVLLEQILSFALANKEATENSDLMGSRLQSILQQRCIEYTDRHHMDPSHKLYEQQSAQMTIFLNIIRSSCVIHTALKQELGTFLIKLQQKDKLYKLPYVSSIAQNNKFTILNTCGELLMNFRSELQILEPWAQKFRIVSQTLCTMKQIEPQLIKFGPLINHPITNALPNQNTQGQIIYAQCLLSKQNPRKIMRGQQIEPLTALELRVLEQCIKRTNVNLQKQIGDYYGIDLEDNDQRMSLSMKVNKRTLAKSLENLGMRKRESELVIEDDEETTDEKSDDYLEDLTNVKMKREEKFSKK